MPKFRVVVIYDIGSLGQTGILRRTSPSSWISWLSSEKPVCRHLWRHDDKKATLLTEALKISSKYGASGGNFSESNYASNSALSFSVTWLTFYMRRHFCITCLWNCFIFHRIWRGLKVRNVYLMCAEQSPIYREFKYQHSIGIRWLFSWNIWFLFTGKNENTLHLQWGNQPIFPARGAVSTSVVNKLDSSQRVTAFSAKSVPKYVIFSRKKAWIFALKTAKNI